MSCWRLNAISPRSARCSLANCCFLAFPAFAGAAICTVASNYASAAGANPTISVFDELWAYSSERSRRLFDEMVPPPTRKVTCRLTTTYAGFEGESALLEDLYKRGMQQQQVGPDLYAGDGLLMFWSHTPVAPWQDEAWLAQMLRSLRPNQYLRMIENRFVGSGSSFIDMSLWDSCVNPNVCPALQDRQLPIWVGVDASTKHDSTAIVACTCDKKAQCVRLVAHRIFVPAPGDPINFEQTIEQTIFDWRKRFALRKVWFDPYQMAATSQRLAKEHIQVEEFPQTVGNLTAACQNLFDLLTGRNIVLYPSADIRLAANRAIAVEGSRGWRLDKLKQSHKIDVIVSLSMAALAAVKGQSEPYYNLWGNAFSTEDEPAPSLVPKRKHPQFTDEEYDRITAPVSLIPAEVRRMYK
jgi:hypothetical protein